MRSWLLIALFGCACGGDDGPPVPADVHIAVLRQVTWPGGGHELTVRVDSNVGAVAPTEVVVRGAGVADFQARATALEPGITALVIEPQASAQARDQVALAIGDFVDSRPAGERIGLFVAAADIVQLGNFSADRNRLHALAGRVASIAPSSGQVDLEGALASLDAEVLAVEGRAPRKMRAIVVLGTAVAGVILPPTRVPVIVADSSGQPPALALASAATAIDELAATGFATFAICADVGGVAATLTVPGLVGETPIGLASTPAEDRDLPCSHDDIFSAIRDYPERLEFVFTAAEREVYDERTAALSKADFALGIRLRSGTEPVRAAAHLRGAGTLACERKNYTIDLEGPARHLLPHSRADEFHLLSMCADDRYIEQHTANQLMAELGVFPLEFRYVELIVDGDTHGVYLLLEKAKEELVRNSSRVRSVMRRSFNKPNTYFEVKYAADGDDAAAITAFADFYAGLAGLAGAELALALGARLDLDSYLRWVALMTAYENGDYVDEMLVMSADQLEDGILVDWFEPMGWDNDDLFSPCHYDGTVAVSDDYELVYCAESELDHLMFVDPVIYARYVDILEELLTEQVTSARFDAAVEYTAARILPYFERADICAAMTRFIAANPGATDPVEAQRDIRARLDELKSNYAARRELLLERITTYRGGS